MKTNYTAHLIKFSLIAFIFTSCTSSINMVEDDDIYSGGRKQISTYAKSPSKIVEPSGSTSSYEKDQYSLPDDRDYSQVQESYRNQSQEQDNSQVQYQEESPVSESYASEYSSDDYYDYAYAARLKRFYGGPSISYYSDLYTNLYWYTYNPSYWGTSIYLGYSWWYPSFYYSSPSWYMGFGWGYGYGYGNYWGHNNYHCGYWNGYYDGYWGSHFYNPYDHNSTTHHYYGPRSGSNSSGTSGLRRGDIDNNSEIRNTARRSFPEVYESRMSSESVGTTGGRRSISNATTNEILSNGSTNTASGLTTRRNLSTPSELIQQSTDRIETNRRTVGQTLTKDASTRSTPTVVRSVQGERSSQEVRKMGTSERSTQEVKQVTPNERSRDIGQSRYGNTESDSQVRRYENPTYPSSKPNSGYTSPQYNKERERSSTPTRSTTTATPTRSTTTATPTRSTTTATPTRSTTTTTPTRSTTTDRSPSSSAPSRSSSYSAPSSSSSSSSAPSRSSSSGARR